MKLLTRQFDGHDFYYIKGMPQIDLHFMSKIDPVFGGPGELWICKKIVELMEPDWNFLDGGAHFGQIGLVAAKRTEGKVYCFEPEPINYSILEENCKLFDNMIPFQEALYDKTDMVQFLKKRAGVGSHKIDACGNIEVISRKLDDYNFSIEMMSIDVEGSGVKFLKGAEKTIRTTKYICFDKHGGEEEADKILKDYGFKIELPWDNTTIFGYK